MDRGERGPDRNKTWPPFPRRCAPSSRKGGGGPEVLQVVERPVPRPGTGRDPRQGRGGGRQPAGRAPAAGRTIRRRPARRTSSGSKSPARSSPLARGAHRFPVGDRVMALVAGGGYAEYAKVHETNAPPVPAPACPWRRPAPSRRPIFTVWTNVFERGALKAGETLPGAWRHLGHRHDGDPARQGVRRAASSRPRAVRRNARPAGKLGADLAINYREADFVAAVKEFTGGKGADVILDMVGGTYIPRNYEAAGDGRPHRADRLPRRPAGSRSTSCA